MLVECENYVGWVIDVKVCKKCKGHVANKTRICKYCGADVSKARIIKTVNNVSNHSVKVNNKKSKFIKNNYECVKQSEYCANEKKQNPSFDTVNTVKNVTTSFNFAKIVQGLLPIKTRLIKIFKLLKIWCCKFLVKFEVFLKWIFCTFDKMLDFVSEIISVIILNVCKYGNILLSFIFSKLFWIFKTIIIGIKKGIVLSFRGFIKFFHILKHKIKCFGLFISATVRKYSLASLERKRLRQIKKNEKYSNRMVVKEKKSDAKQTNNDKSFNLLKPVLVISFVLVFLGTCSYVGINVYSNLRGSTNSVVVSEKATREKIFAMNDVITYNGVDYKIVKVEKSKGNSYKSPKEGNQFLIVTVYIKNNTDGKVPYSYENWTMSNSKGEEKKRIFTSINVNNALYSGELVIGGIKVGSMVFEQPINDAKLILNYYDLKKDDNGNDVIDEARREFSVSIKVPSGDNDSSINDSDTKVIQTTDKIKN